jgi:hypothetical protein
VRAYVPEVVRARLGAGQAEWLAELRRVTALFLNLVDADPAAADQLERLQLVMATVQPILQRYEGSLKQVVVDDKGLTLIAVFGLPPLAHEDDPARATRAALGVQAALEKLGVRCAGLVGIDDVEERRRRVLARVRADPQLGRLAPLLNSVLPLELPDNELTA